MESSRHNQPDSPVTLPEAYKTAIASIIASPIGPTMLWKPAPQRGQVLASVEIIAPHARHEVILDMTLPAPPANTPLWTQKQADLGSSERLDMFTAVRSRPETSSRASDGQIESLGIPSGMRV